MGVEGGRATDYIIRLSKNVKRGNTAKLERGEWPGAKPLGYIYDDRLRNIVPDPERWQVVLNYFHRIRRGTARTSRRVITSGDSRSCESHRKAVVEMVGLAVLNEPHIHRRDGMERRSIRRPIQDVHFARTFQ
jgi:hypothetical protein